MDPARNREVGHWIAVASAEHVALGRALGFMQVGHGKGAPLRRLRRGDRVAYYSPVRVLGTKDEYQSFTAIGTLLDERIYQADMAGGFKPFRRDVGWWPANPAPIRPLLPALAFTRDTPNWGQAFRYGLFRVAAADFARIAQAMDCAALASTGLEPA
ncbi:MAG TPA: EVE domain-containing protein [Burkholderiaceae bacterium]|nr:EVE domain-containing protein [Burkholderiaceae bacterium]